MSCFKIIPQRPVSLNFGDPIISRGGSRGGGLLGLQLPQIILVAVAMNRGGQCLDVSDSHESWSIDAISLVELFRSKYALLASDPVLERTTVGPHLH